MTVQGPVHVSEIDKVQFRKAMSRTKGIDYQEYLDQFDTKFTGKRIERTFNQKEALCFFTEENGSITSFSVIAPRPWDKDHFGFPVAALYGPYGSDTAIRSKVLRTTMDYAWNEGYKLITARVGYDGVGHLRALEDEGFRFADAMNVFLWDRIKVGLPNAENDSPVTVRPFRAEEAKDHIAVRDLAAHAFRGGRVLDDPLISSKHKEDFYPAIVESLVQRKDTTVLIAEFENEAVGFIIGAPDPDLHVDGVGSVGCLWLIAVSPSTRGHNVGNLLLIAFLRAFGESGRYVEVCTQTCNTPALRLYSKLGLIPVSSVLTFHAWQPSLSKENEGTTCINKT